MSYKVFLVEDEIFTREGIRNTLDWETLGFTFCGEASDGEIALPMIQSSKPDVIITDIKMPFMDGLQLSKIVREHMPWVKIIILSGHDEFNYAQSAVKLGVTEYLLKPVSAQDLSSVLEKLSETLDREHHEREKLKSLQSNNELNMVFNREKFLLKLVMGGVSSTDAIEQSQQFGLDIVAKYYLVVLIRIVLCEDSQPFDYQEYQQVEQIVSEFAGNNVDVLLTKKDPEELILLIKSDSSEQIMQEGIFLSDLIENEIIKRTTCNVVIEIGSPQDRIGNIHHSFAEALVKSKSEQSTLRTPRNNAEQVDLIKMDHEAIENYLNFGSIQDFDEFFSTTIEPLCEIALQSYLMKHYLFLNIILTVRQFVSDLGGDLDQLNSDVHEIENILKDMISMEQFKEEMKKIFITALTFRTNQANHERVLILQRAKVYIDNQFADPDLKMSKVAAKFNISPSHFSTIFHQEFGITYRDYLSKIRINHAKELLVKTNRKCSEVAYQCGFNDSHYFSTIFKKRTGLTPQQFREKSQDKC